MFSRKAIFVLFSLFALLSAFFLVISFSDVSELTPKIISQTTTQTTTPPEDAQAPPLEQPANESESDPAPVKPAPAEPAPAEPAPAEPAPAEPAPAEPAPAEPAPAEPAPDAPKDEPTVVSGTSRPAGCGIVHDFVGKPHQNFTLQSGGLERTYWVRLPEDYDPDVEMPVVIGYAPKGTEAVGYDRYTGFSHPKVNPGMITVWPIAIDLSWQGAPSAPPGVNDLNFTTDLIHQLKQDYCIGPILATGHSNGAGFVGNLACSAEHGKDFAAFAPVAGTFYTDVVGDEGCQVTEDIRPILEIHGDADEFARYHGGTKDAGWPIPSIPEWVYRWAVRNGCDMNPTVTDLGSKIEKSYTCGGRKGLVRHLRVKGHGHGWIGIDKEGKFMDGFMTPEIIAWFREIQGLPELPKDEEVVPEAVESAE